MRLGDGTYEPLSICHKTERARANKLTGRTGPRFRWRSCKHHEAEPTGGGSLKVRFNYADDCGEGAVGDCRRRGM